MTDALSRRDAGPGPGSMAFVMTRTPVGAAPVEGRLAPGRPGHVWIGYHPRYAHEDLGPVWVEIARDTDEAATAPDLEVRLLEGVPAAAPP
ncbi:hypothetical protein KBZ94_35620 [Streptomyces sp. RM72]|uniref:hypothetical protein n=1 Tax=Streptomyces sp. RM72 TaxID=1115510 RepID=UPI001B35CDE8|nr:hypothetical protein [Streptomyces sp. RM72]MBQ0890190.1 hypothetical protein [Streptomyces sp. RM72]